MEQLDAAPTSLTTTTTSSSSSSSDGRSD